MSDSNDEAPVAVVSAPASVLENAPWWMISAGFHVVLLLGATLIAVERVVDIGDDTIFLSGPIAKEQIRYDDPPKEDSHRPPGVDQGEKELEDSSNDRILKWDDAIPGDHNESDEGIDGDTMKGQSDQANTAIPGTAMDGLLRSNNSNNAGLNASIGIGPGGGSTGRFGNGTGGRRNIRNVGQTGNGTVSQKAIIDALKWLARHQSPDGSWSADRFGSRCKGSTCAGTGDASFDTGITGLALLAFLGGGYSHLSHDEIPDPTEPGRMLKFGEVVKAAQRWLISQQSAEGAIGVRDEKGVEEMYNHAICTIALSEGYGLTGTPFLQGPAQKAVDYLVAAQNPGKAWRYHSRCGDNDTSVTGWAVMALKSAEMSELAFPSSAYAGATAWLNDVTDNNGYYRVGYNAVGSGRVHNKHNADFQHHESMSAVSMVCRIFMNKNRRDPMLGCAKLLMDDLPKWEDRKIDYYYWYYGSLALFHFDGPSGPSWTKWSTAMEKVLIDNLKKDTRSCQHGSWDAEPERWKNVGGRVYATAINALSLETVYRYDLFSRK